jgi:sugar lactone lactonase YvrE
MKNASDVAFAVAADTRDQLGESPWWDAAGVCLYWVDLRRPALHRLDQLSGMVTTWPMSSFIGAVFGRRIGGVVVLLSDGVHVFDPEIGALSSIAPMEVGAGMRLDDAKCDRDGNLWFGTMRDFGADASGSLYRMGVNGDPVLERAACRIPNGICILPDGRRSISPTRPKGRSNGC